MKLRIKKSGKICELLAVAYDKSDAIILMVKCEGLREMLAYKSLAELHEKIEDYHEETKPALTDEERSYLIAWLRLLNRTSYDGVWRSEDGRLYLMDGKQGIAAIPTFGRFEWWQPGQSFTIEELGL